MKKIAWLLLMALMVMSSCDTGISNSNNLQQGSTTSPLNPNDSQTEKTTIVSTPNYLLDESSNSEVETRKTFELVEIIPDISGNYYAYSEGLGLFPYNSKHGFLDSNGKVFIDAKYGICNIFSEDFAIASNNDGIVIIDKNGNEVFKSNEYKNSISWGSNHYLTTNNIFCFHQGRAMLGLPNSTGCAVIDTSGNEIYRFSDKGTPMRYSCDRAVWFGSSTGATIVDLNGNIVTEIPDVYNDGYGATFPSKRWIYCDDILTLPKTTKLWGAIDTNGNTVIDFSYEALGFAGDGLIPFMKYGKWGYIDYVGNVVIEQQYDKADSFSNGLAAVKLNGEIAYINKDNEVVINFSTYPASGIGDYLSDSRFYGNGLAVVNGETLIDKQGNILLTSEYGGIIYNGGNMVCAYRSAGDKAKPVIFRIVGIE